MNNAETSVLGVSNLYHHFHESIGEAAETLDVKIPKQTNHYVCTMLTTFASSEVFYEGEDGQGFFGIRPLAHMLADANGEPSEEIRFLKFQKIGDVTLFISGFFSNCLKENVVDTDYFIAMGSNAYSAVSDQVRGKSKERDLLHLYEDLAYKFDVLVDVLNEARCQLAPESDINTLRLFEIWRKTGSVRALKMLDKLGIKPMFS